MKLFYWRTRRICILIGISLACNSLFAMQDNSTRAKSTRRLVSTTLATNPLTGAKVTVAPLCKATLEIYDSGLLEDVDKVERSLREFYSKKPSLVNTLSALCKLHLTLIKKDRRSAREEKALEDCFERFQGINNELQAMEAASQEVIDDFLSKIIKATEPGGFVAKEVSKKIGIDRVHELFHRAASKIGLPDGEINALFQKSLERLRKNRRSEFEQEEQIARAALEKKVAAHYEKFVLKKEDVARQALKAEERSRRKQQERMENMISGLEANEIFERSKIQENELGEICILAHQANKMPIDQTASATQEALGLRKCLEGQEKLDITKLLRRFERDSERLKRFDGELAQLRKEIKAIFTDKSTPELDDEKSPALKTTAASIRGIQYKGRVLRWLHDPYKQFKGGDAPYHCLPFNFDHSIKKYPLVKTSHFEEGKNKPGFSSLVFAESLDDSMPIPPDIKGLCMATIAFDPYESTCYHRECTKRPRRLEVARELDKYAQLYAKETQGAGSREVIEKLFNIQTISEDRDLGIRFILLRPKKETTMAASAMVAPSV